MHGAAQSAAGSSRRSRVPISSTDMWPVSRHSWISATR
ncbi:hypothetical protein SMD44_07540 [Streptomyces alboflavus]|uniref:Uncharacterized protein n=1 Tax=Streptomyces alboflavus TaxID=67267 RepID=A0A1Z1WNP8_9ACTN|nr:hypothetical protein SMD44_07540 [Streptomyces alboflavus]